MLSDCFVLAPEEDQVEKLSKVCSLIVLFWQGRSGGEAEQGVLSDCFVLAPEED